MLELPIRWCPNCWYVGPTRRFADDEAADDEAAGYRCPRCGHEVDAPDPRLA